MSTITKVSSCTTTACAFNNDGCTAFAITVGGTEAAACGTFSTLDLRAGLDTADGHVGACQRLDCKHNENLMCTSASIDIVGEAANCASYAAR
ncbi:DUF1540 domain-containing protein [Corynebacterium testudinoris]|uniref:Putative DUF1540 family protein n=1 Tax=Corynebacterium testudinoris TaxID=136857 RepID=A0A0G3H2C1_9CORY|nr:DUF1540 domain-containing protein [Corynebacterium testudinoris]AKK07559.1 putative DUF1540 family protein [Corynebacterium testudinoris]MBX8995011.1 DUF1540 domain-containing protein [Corynebacterium testudinoris]